MISMQNPSPQTTYVRDLPYTGMANGFPGRHVFRIDEKILPGVCIRCWPNIFNIRYFQYWPSIFSYNYRIFEGPDRGQFAAGVRPREWEHVGGHDGQPDRALLWAGHEGDLQVWWWGWRWWRWHKWWKWWWIWGTMVNLTGPCFEPGMRVTCRFDYKET